MESSQALTLNVTGKVSDFNGARRFEGEGLIAKLTYDLEKLWPIVHPMLKPGRDPANPNAPAPEDPYKDLKIAGKSTEQFVLTGAFPANGAFHEKMASLSGSGGLSADRLVFQGLNVQRRFTLPVVITNGKARIAGDPVVAPPLSPRRGRRRAPRCSLGRGPHRVREPPRRSRRGSWGRGPSP